MILTEIEWHDFYTPFTSPNIAQLLYRLIASYESFQETQLKHSHCKENKYLLLDRSRSPKVFII